MAKKFVNEMTAVEMVKAISAGETNCEEIVRANLFAIEAREDDVQAWVHVDAENAIASASGRSWSQGTTLRAAGRVQGYGGYADGVWIGYLPGYRPDVDAARVALVKEAGVRKAVTTEFVNPNKTRNPIISGTGGSSRVRRLPWWLWHWPSTQTGGSVIRPASFWSSD